MNITDAKILITGAGGFLGQHVLGQLRGMGCKRIAAPRKRDYDLTREADIKALLLKERPEIVLHLAAVVGGIGANRMHPGSFLYQNLIMGTLLIEASRKAAVDKFVQIGTICSYPKYTPVPFKEEDFWNGYPEETNAPYGLAKKMLFAQIQAYRQEYGFNGINLLLVNLYGPGDNFDLTTSHVIPALIRKFMQAREQAAPRVTCWGTGTPTREFLYVEDAARAICQAAEVLDTPDPINIGTGEEITIADLSTMIADKVGYQGDVVFDANYPDGQPRRCLDISKAQALMDYCPRVSLSEGLDRTIEWYLSKYSYQQSQAA